MTRSEMDPTLAHAVRAELTAIGTTHSRLQRHQRRVRILAVGIGIVAIAGVTTAAAIVVNNLQGSTTVVPIGGISTATHTGTGTVDLGPAPADAGAVILRVTCLNQQGTVSIETKPQNPGSAGDFLTIYCDGRTTPVHITDGLLPKPGSTTITITADPGTKWKATAEYASSSTSAWGVNSRGQTFGLCNHNGCPDLMAAQVVNGEEAYVNTKEFDTFEGSGYIKVYKSDGTTVVGRFAIGIPDDGRTPVPTR
jgi:hypothetical protein